MQSTDVQVDNHLIALIYDETHVLLVSGFIRGSNGAVIDGHVVNGNWRFRKYIGDIEYSEEILIPKNVNGNYNDIINWALENRVSRRQTLLDVGQ